MIQKLSPQKPFLENRMRMLQEIATENGIVLQLDDVSPVIKEVTKLNQIQWKNCKDFK